MLPLTSHFKDAHLQSGRTVEEALTSPIRKVTILGEYEITHNSEYGTFVLTFFPKSDKNHSVLVADDLISFQDAVRAQQFDYIDRLKAAVIAKSSQKFAK